MHHNNEELVQLATTLIKIHLTLAFLTMTLPYLLLILTYHPRTKNIHSIKHINLGFAPAHLSLM